MEDYQIHYNNLIGISNSNGVFAYFIDENKAHNFTKILNFTIRRLEMLLETIELSDETSYNELEVILEELKAVL